MFQRKEHYKDRDVWPFRDSDPEPTKHVRQSTVAPKLKGNIMSNTTGERTFSTAGRTVAAKKEFPLIPVGNHKGLMGSDFEIAKADRWDGVPYVKFSASVNGTATKEGGKDMRVFHMLFLSILPGADGEVNTDRADGIVALAKSLATEMEGVEIVTREVTNPENGETIKQEYLNPKQVVEFLKAFSGVEFGFRIKTEKGTKGYSDKSKIQKFLLPDAA